MLDEIISSLKARFNGSVDSEFRGQRRVVVAAAAADVYAVLEFLKNEHAFDMLVDITCVDYLNYRNAGDRFGMVYLLAATQTSLRLTVRVMLNEPELWIASVTPLWEGAKWMEREVWDMFGISFEGHPDLRRILMPDEFVAHPLRKDYPLQGRGERLTPA